MIIIAYTGDYSVPGILDDFIYFSKQSDEALFLSLVLWIIKIRFIDDK